jgi:hypothetical protein
MIGTRPNQSLHGSGQRMISLLSKHFLVRPVTLMLVNSCALVYSTEIRDSLRLVFVRTANSIRTTPFDQWHQSWIIYSNYLQRCLGITLQLRNLYIFLMPLKSTVWNWLFRHSNLKWSYLIKLNPVATVSRAFGFKPLPNQSLHGRMPWTFLINHYLPVRHSPWLLC